MKQILAIILLGAMALGAGVTERMPTDTVQFGKSGSADDKELIFDVGDGASNPRLNVDTTDKDVQVNVSFTILDDLLKIGTGAAADQVIEFDRGSGVANPKLKWSEVDSSIAFANDGVNFKKLGSGSGSGGGGTNTLAESNFDFETADPPQSWSASGGTFSAETTAPLFGEQSGLWDSNALGQTLDSAAGPISAGFLGQRCQVSLDYLYPVGTVGDYKLVVRQFDNSGASTIDVLEIPLNVVTIRNPAQQIFNCPDDVADTLTLRIESTVADADPITIDNAFLGTGRNIINAVPKNILETRILNADVSVNTTIGDLTFTGLQVGVNYSLRAKIFGQCGTSDASFSVSAIHDSVLVGAWSVGGTTGSTDIQGATFTADFTATNTTLEFENTGIAGAGQCTLFGNGTASQTIAVLEKRNDLSSAFSEAITLETSSQNWSGYITGVGSTYNIGTGSGTETVNSGAWNMVNTGPLDAQIPCLAGETPGGTTCSGSEVPGVSFVPVQTANHEICMRFNNRIVMSANTGISNRFYLAEIDVATGTHLDKNFPMQYINAFDSASTAQHTQTGDICIEEQLTAGQRITYYLTVDRTVNGGSPSSNEFLDDQIASMDDHFFTFTIKNLDQQIPSPIFTGLQNSLKQRLATPLATVQQNICSGRIETFSGSGTVLVDESNCIDNIVRNGAGDYNVNFITGYQPTDAVCTVSPNDNSGFYAHTVNAGLEILRVRIKSAVSDSNTDGDTANEGFEFICVGGNQ